MDSSLILDKQDLAHLSWSVISNSSCTTDSFLKAYSELDGEKTVNSYWSKVLVQTGGFGVTWDVNLNISDRLLYRIGRPVPLTSSDFHRFITHNIINRAEAAELLDCFRQNIDDLTKRGKLHPIKSSAKNMLYLKNEVMKRNWL